jgi:mono/diheme cytochrome c family protein
LTATRLFASRIRSSVCASLQGRGRSFVCAGHRLAIAVIFLLAAWETPVRADEKHQQKPTPAPVASTAAKPETANGSAKTYRDTVRPFVRKYCIECHGNDTTNGAVNFETLADFSTAVAARKTWDKARKMLETTAMPPADHPTRPTEPEIADVLRWVNQSVFDDDCSKVRDPGHVTVRRLNRAEYNNTIRDLAGVKFRPADDFPSDDVGNGFDNQGEVLSISPLLMERYLSAAERISSVALYGVDLKNPPLNRLDNRKMTLEGATQLTRKKYAREKHFLLPSVGAVDGTFRCPMTGDYVLRVVAMARQLGNERARLEVRVDGAARQVFELSGEAVIGHYELRLHLSNGTHKFVASFTNPPAEPPSPPALPQAALRGKAAKKADRPRLAREIEIERFELEGPFAIDSRDPSFASLETRKRILSCAPGADQSPAQCAARILTRFATRAFRRPVEPAEIKPYVDLAIASAPDGPLDRAIQTGITAVLVSPHFLFRVEQPGAATEGNDPTPIGAFELASRLSYFLWSSMPDEELFRLAGDGTLKRTDVLAAQVRRMLKDARSQALVANFAAQWLNLGLLDLASPNTRVFKTFDNDLRKDMRRETELFFQSLVRDDRHVLDLLNGKYTFLNERLADFYNIKGITGDQFREVSLEGSPRAGVLTQASILTLTSQRTRTSPVKRGKWILDTFLGEAPPPPPANVPELSETQKSNPRASLRDQLALHRKSASCAICHKIMDPLGLGLENFDGIGRWREKEKNHPIDASGSLPGGQSFRGPVELIGVLSKRQDAFRRHFAETLLAYALGRGVEYYDRCALERIVEGARRGDDRFSALVTEIVRSDPFLLRRGGSNRNDQ